MSEQVLSLCDRTGNMVRPWIEAGHNAVTVDMQPASWEHPRRRHIVADVTLWRPEAWGVTASVVFAFPPCTHLAVSGARWWKDKGLSKVIEALQIVEACRVICETSGAPYMIENPIGSLSKYWRDPDYKFHPVHYAGYAPDPDNDCYTKKTCLWTGHGFVMPDRKPMDPIHGSKMHLMAPSDERADARSETPMGFAQAVFVANGARSSKRKRAANSSQRVGR